MQRKVRIWTKIFFIVLVAIIPTVIITIYTSLAFQQTYIKETKTQLTNLCDGFSNEQRLIARNAEEMLLAVSQTHAVQDQDYATLNVYLRDLMVVYHDYAVLLVADSNGKVIASGVQKTGYFVNDRDYFIHAQKTGKFTIGTYIISRSTGIPSITFTLPVTDRKGAVVFLIGTYALEKYSRELSLNRLEKNTILEIFDYRGQRLFSSVFGSQAEAGKPVNEALYSWVANRPQTGVSTLVVDGQPALVASGVFTRNGQSLHITVRTSYKSVVGESYAPAIRILIVMLLACLSAFALSLWLARRLFVVRVEKLTAYTQAMAGGDLSVRTDINNARDEISNLMESFNKMAAALEERNLSTQRTIEEKEALLKELQKRVADNLQILSSMVNLQIEHASEDIVRYSLITTHSRIMALSLVYETIYRFSDVQQVQMQGYCKGLCDFLVSLYADVGSNISCFVSGSDISLPIEKALPLALILNELVSNSLLHAFPGSKNGSISIVFGPGPASTLKMSIVDNGIGFDGDIHQNDTLGFEMIEALVEQLKGTMTVKSGGTGSDISVQFPLHI